MDAGGAAGEEDEEEGEEEHDGTGEDGPHASGEAGLVSAAILVDVVLHDHKEGEIGSHDDEGDHEGQGRNGGSEEGAAHARSQRDQEGEERETRDDGVEDHDAGQSLSGVFGDGVEAGLVNGGHDRSRVVSNVPGAAEVVTGPREGGKC